MKRSLLLLALMALFTISHAQPGYLGRKNVLSLECNLNPVFYNTKGLLLNPWSLNFEKVSSEKAAWVFGLSYGRLGLSSDDFEFYSDILMLKYMNSSTNEFERFSITGDMQYSVLEFSAQRRWYFKSVGSVAPYGLYFGIQIDYSRIKEFESNLKYFSKSTGIRMDRVNEKVQPVKSLSPFLILGVRRMISNRVAVAGQVGLGWMIWDSEGSRFSIENITDLGDFERSVISSEYSNFKFIKFGIQIGYLF